MSLPFPFRRHLLVGGLAFVLAASSAPAFAAEPPPAAPAATEATALDITARTDLALQRGAQWLIDNQNPDGTWGKYPQPGIAALCVLALIQAPVDGSVAGRDAAIKKGVDYVLGFVQEDGAVAAEARRRFLFFKGSSYPVYTTSITLLMLAELGRPEDRAIMVGAREYLKGIQHGDPDQATYGGYGYDAGKRADLSNTAWAAEALYRTEYLEQEGAGVTVNVDAQARSTAMWKGLDSFLAKLQDLKAPAAGTGAAAATAQSGSVAATTEDGGTDLGSGGFGYAPGGGSSLVATGSMTYAGLKSMLYARLERNDARVKGALRFISAHYDVQTNPGEGKSGLYYYLLTMTKALDAYGQETLTLADGSERHWRDDIRGAFLGMQQDDGSWANPEGRYMEALPSLATAYAMISLKVAQRTPQAVPTR